MKKIPVMDLTGAHVMTAVEMNHLHFCSARSEMSGGGKGAGGGVTEVRDPASRRSP